MIASASALASGTSLAVGGGITAFGTVTADEAAVQSAAEPPVPVPEPGTAALLFAALAGWIFAVRRSILRYLILPAAGAMDRCFQSAVSTHHPQ